MSFISELASADKKGLFTSNDNFVSYSTGILPLDYANGFWLKSEGQAVPVIGIKGGSFNGIIGDTGTGKSTFADQVGYSIIKPFEDGALIHIDCELTNYKQRMVNIMGTKMLDDRVILKKDAIYIEDVLDMFSRICRLKEEGGNRYKYEVEQYGKKFLAYVPTVFIIDSLPSFNSREFNVEDEGTNMDGARGAKDITRFYVNCLARMEKYNITIFTINHIKPEVKADRFSQPPKGLMMLRPGETLTRGQASQYYSQNYFRLNAIKSNIYKPDDVGFTGMKNTIQLAKTKTSFIGATMPVAFNSKIGFDPIYTLYEFASENGLLLGRNPHLYLVGCEDFKFSRKEFRHRFLTDNLFRESFMANLTPYLEALLGSKDLTEEEQVEFGDLMMAEEEQVLADLEN